MTLLRAYTGREETRVGLLQSDAYCVWYWKTFKSMHWPSKLMELSFIVVPLCVSSIAWLHKADGLYWGIFWIAASGLVWWTCFATLSQYVRGWFAQRRGVAPAPNPRRSTFTPSRGMLVFAFAMACLCVVMLVSRPHDQRLDRNTQVVALLFLLAFFQYLSSYPRSHLDDPIPDRGHRAKRAPRTPASPSPPSPSRPA
jgi:hypothetical protein